MRSGGGHAQHMERCRMETVREPSSSRSQKVPEKPHYLRGKVWELDVQLVEENFLDAVWFKEGKEEGLYKDSQVSCHICGTCPVPVLAGEGEPLGHENWKRIMATLPLPAKRNFMQTVARETNYAMLIKKGNGRFLFLIMVGKVIWTKVPTEKYQNFGCIFLNFLEHTKHLRRE